MTKQIKSTCCGLPIAAEGNKIVGVRGDATHSSFFARPCPNAAMVHLTAQPDCRLGHPDLSHERAVPNQRVARNQALGHAGRGFVQIIKAHVPDSAAFYFFRQLLSDDCDALTADSFASGALLVPASLRRPAGPHHARRRPSAKRSLTSRAGRASSATAQIWRKFRGALRGLWARRCMRFGMDLNAELLWLVSARAKIIY